MARTRQEHMRWCKDRAHKYIKAGNGQEAITSMLSDLRKHEGTAPSVQIAFSLMMMTNPKDMDAVREFVDGFN